MENNKKPSIAAEKILILFLNILIPTLLWGILVLASIYLFTLISFQPYGVWKDFQAKPKFYFKLSFGLSFIFVLAIATTAFLLKKIKQSKI